MLVRYPAQGWSKVRYTVGRPAMQRLGRENMGCELRMSKPSLTSLYGRAAWLAGSWGKASVVMLALGAFLLVPSRSPPYEREHPQEVEEPTD
jgi:hypothetical protein